MNTQTDREPREDAEKKRRAYLVEMSRAGSIFAMVCVMAGAAILADVMAGFMAGVLITTYVPNCLPLSIASVPLVIAVQAVVLLKVIHFCKSQAKRLTSISYVPPVRKQLAALSAEEILVRGSGRPEADPGELLRAAREGIEAGAEELVRAS